MYVCFVLFFSQSWDNHYRLLDLEQSINQSINKLVSSYFFFFFFVLLVVVVVVVLLFLLVVVVLIVVVVILLLLWFHHVDAYPFQLLQEVNIHIVPSLNPDGAEQSIVGKCETGPGHSNKNNVDLDTNFKKPGKGMTDSIAAKPPEFFVIIRKSTCIKNQISE